MASDNCSASIVPRLLAQLRQGGGRAPERPGPGSALLLQPGQTARARAGPRWPVRLGLGPGRPAHGRLRDRRALGRFDPPSVGWRARPRPQPRSGRRSPAASWRARRRCPSSSRWWATAVNRLYPVGNQLAQALQAAAGLCDVRGRAGGADGHGSGHRSAVPGSLLGDFDHPEMAQRVERGGPAPGRCARASLPVRLEPGWRICTGGSDRQTMGSVVQELAPRCPRSRSRSTSTSGTRAIAAC